SDVVNFSALLIKFSRTRRITSSSQETQTGPGGTSQRRIRPWSTGVNRLAVLRTIRATSWDCKRSGISPASRRPTSSRVVIITAPRCQPRQEQTNAATGSEYLNKVQLQAEPPAL